MTSDVYENQIVVVFKTISLSSCSQVFIALLGAKTYNSFQEKVISFVDKM